LDQNLGFNPVQLSQIKTQQNSLTTKGEDPSCEVQAGGKAAGHCRKAARTADLLVKALLISLDGHGKAVNFGLQTLNLDLEAGEVEVVQLPKIVSSAWLSNHRHDVIPFIRGSPG